MLKLSCADYTFPLLGRAQALALIRLLGFDFVDIGLFGRSATFPPSALNASPRFFIDEVRRDLAAAGLRAGDVFLQVGVDPAQSSVNDPDARVRQATRDTFCRALEVCSAIACPHLTGLPGVSHGNGFEDMARAADETAWRVEKAAAAGVIYAIEAHVGSICADTGATHRFLSQVTGLTLTLDYGHFVCQGEVNEAIHLLLRHASHVHLRGAAPGRLQTPVAESTVDFAHIVRMLSVGYRGTCALEYVWTDWQECNRTDNVSETILLRRHITEIENEMNSGEPQHV